MDQSVGPRPVANGYTNARTNKLTLTQTQVKCFNSCQKTCKKPIFAFRFLQPSCPRGRASRGSPGPCPRLGFSAARWQSSVREEVLGIYWREGGMEAAHSPRLGLRWLHSPGKGVLAAPGAAWWGQVCCLLATYQIQRSWSHRPWHVPLRRGREEEHKPRRDTVGEEHGEPGQLDLCPEGLPLPPPHPRAWGGSPCSHHPSRKPNHIPGWVCGAEPKLPSFLPPQESQERTRQRPDSKSN